MANTFDAALITAMLADRTLTVLQNRLAPLAAFSADFGTDRLKPRATVEVPIASVAGSTQTNPTDFEPAGGATLTKAEVSVSWYNQPFKILASEYQQGFRLQQLIDIHLAAFADAIIDVALTPVTVANYGAATLSCDPSAFGADEVRTLYAALKKSEVKNLVLDSNFYARFLPVSALDLGPRPGTGGIQRWYENTRWSGAGTGIRGFICNPQALAVASGLPLDPPDSGREYLAADSVTIPGLGLSVAYYVWFSRGARAHCASFDVMFGAAKADATAMKLVIDTSV
jgi:hypothetical protein